MMRVLITGIAGSGGSYMADYIAQNHPHAQIHGIARWHTATHDNLAHLKDFVTVHEADLLDEGSVLKVLRDVAPDAIIHLASHANVKVSFQSPAAVMNNNIIGTVNLFEAVRFLDLQCRVLHCSTSEVYGQVDIVPIREDAPIRAGSPYAISKVAQDLLAKSYFDSYGMKIIRTRMFTYINPRRADLFATSFARQVALCEAGLQDEIVHGNLDSVRTMLDVRDACEAYWLALMNCDPGEVYNIGGTTTMTVGDVLTRLVGMAHRPIVTRADPALFRPSDVTLQIPCTTKFVKATGWAPRYQFEESLRDLLDYWRDRVRISG